jgi:predicted MPP superfamily phosphohydrolase
MTRRAVITTSLVLCAPVLCLAVWGFWIEPASLRNETYRLTLDEWPAECSPLRVAVLADLHVGSPFNGLAKLQRVVSLTREAKPDLILLGGDYVIHGVLGGSFVEPETIAAALARLSAPMGIYAVLGNHDWWYGAAKVRQALESHSIRVLEDQSAMVSRGQCTFWLAGIGDYWEGRHDVQRALRSIPAATPVIALTHNPDVFPDIPRRVALTIAAHTHGGQVALPFLGRPIVPSRYGQRYAIGHIIENGHDLFVTSGVGTSIIPVRLGVPPEISILEITRTGSLEPKSS